MIVPFVILYANGFIFTTKTSSVVLTGGIYAQSKISGPTLYINNAKVDTFGFFSKGLYVKDLSPGRYNIEIKDDGYKTWSKSIEVKPGIVSSASSILIPDLLILDEIPRHVSSQSGDYLAATSTPNSATTIGASSTVPNPEYELVAGLMKKKDLIATSSKSAIIRNSVAVWTEKGVVNVSWLDDPETRPDFFCVLDSSDKEECSSILSIPLVLTQIKFIDFMPGRDDALVLGSNSSVFIVEIDGRSKRLIEKIYSGTSPQVKINGGTIYIKDGSKIWAAML
jgi:hypothetical protein